MTKITERSGMFKDNGAGIMGSAQGIGRIIAKALAEQAGNIILSAVNAEDCQKTANKITVKTVVQLANVANKSDIAKAARFLAAAEVNSITGVFLRSDAGMAIGF